MNTPRIIVRYFDYPASGKWKRMAKALTASIERHCSNWDADIRELAPPPDTKYSQLGLQGNVGNTQKLDAWNVVVQGAEDGERLLLLDADTLVRRSIDDVWDQEFDLAYTVKPLYVAPNQRRRHPFNGGVIFLRVSERTKRFMAQWQADNDLFLRDPREHQVWRGEFGGINQAALGKILTQGAHGLSLVKLPCLEWNLEDEHWSKFNPDVTRIVHYKSDLQRAILEGLKASAHRALVQEWKAMEQAPVDVTDHVIGGLQQPEHHMMVVPHELTTPETGQPRRLNRRERRKLAQEATK